MPAAPTLSPYAAFEQLLKTVALPKDERGIDDFFNALEVPRGTTNGKARALTMILLNRFHEAPGWTVRWEELGDQPYPTLKEAVMAPLRTAGPVRTFVP